MTTLFSRDQILQGLIVDVVDCLSIETSDIQPESPIFSAGDSLEILDITFRIQKRFGIRVQLHSLLEGWEMDSDGKLSAATLQKLTTSFPQIDWHSRVVAIQGNDPFELLTVGLLAEMVFNMQTTDERPSSNSNGSSESTMVSSFQRPL